MTSQQDRLRAKAERLAAAKTTPKPEPAEDRTAEDQERALVQSTLQTKPVRSTVDLLPARHAQLKAWCGETAIMIGRSRVTTQNVMNALVARLLTDETLARKIRDDLRVDQ